MANEPGITDAQLRRLQTLWGQYARHEMIKNSREERLHWASTNAQRAIFTFNELSLSEASNLINLLQSNLGLAETKPNMPRRRYRSRIKDRDLAHAAGTEGRRSATKKRATMASAEDLQMIDNQLTAMHWTRSRLDAFLRSPSSPLGVRRSNPCIRTVGDVNRVLDGLRGIERKKTQGINGQN